MERTDRRGWLRRVVNGAALAVTGVVGAPLALTALSPVLRRGGGEAWRPVGPADAFLPGQMHKAVVDLGPEDWFRPLAAQAVYVWAAPDGGFVVFSRACTDLGCPLTWDNGSEWFFCPCHGGIFSRDGDRVAGPPSRPMYRYAHRVRNGALEIDLNSLPPTA